ncbi:MAG TPA: LacI family transcriptional regulator [Firmicutes bacterium]|jgi:LacI family transcriptional regulator|nr:LacI family transcriptional regulator [Bacillota bacterium]
MPTIKDVAKKAGVSYATVSRALNNHPEINEETRKKIVKISSEMGYQPNAIAQGLVKKETKTIGLLIPDITNPFFPEVARGVEDAANMEGYSVFLCNTNWSEEQEERYLEVLMQKQVDGIIIGPSSERTGHIKKVFHLGIKPAVFISRIDYPNSTSILIDNISGARIAVEYLISKGHKKIAFIGGLKDAFSNQDRLLGYKNALEMNGIPINQDYILNGDFKRESGHQATQKVLQVNLRPTAIFAANDMLALGAIQAIKEEGLVIPGDISVVGFDDIGFAALPEIQLTTIAQPKYDMGRLAFLTLLDQIKGGDSVINKRILLNPELIIRKTS